MPELTRRRFARIATLIGAGSTLPFYNEAALAQLSRLGPMPPGAVKINANENPLGPCAEAAEAIQRVIQSGGRYQYEEADLLAQTAAELEGLKPEYVLPFGGSSDPLHRAVIAFTSPSRAFVVADPSYEAGERAAQFVGAKVVRVPLAKDYSHDVRAMVQADRQAGLIYVCTPNNPTGTLTSRQDVDYVLANKPKDSILLLDEAYLHFSDAAPCTDLVAADKDVIILRTFSKLYGMAGLRAGLAFARPDLLAKLRPYGAGALPLTGMVGATASLKAKNLVPARRKINREIREDVFAFLEKNHFSFVPSVTNHFMLDVKRPGQEAFKMLASEGIFVGRVWPSWPTHVRVTVGTREEMIKFQTALSRVLS